MTIRLIFERKDSPGSEARVFDKDVVVVGREVVAGDDAEAAWVLPHVDVSRRQCRFSRSGGALYVEGLSARNGTFVNSRRIEGVTRLRGGDQVRFGNCRIRVPGEAGEASRERSGELGGGEASTLQASGRAVPPGVRVIVPSAQAGSPSPAPPPNEPDVGHRLVTPPVFGDAKTSAPEAGDVPEDMSPVVARARRWDELGRSSSLLLRDAEGLRRSQVWLRRGAGLGGDAVLVRTFVQASELARNARRRRTVAVGLWALAVAGFGAGTASGLAHGLDFRDEEGVDGSGRPLCTEEARKSVEAATVAPAGESEAAALQRLAGAVELAEEKNCLAETSAEADLRRRLAGQSSELLAGPPHEGRITQLSSRADGARVVSVGEDGRLRVWDRERPGAEDSSEEIGEGIEATRALWSADQRWLVVGGSRGEVAIFDGATWPPSEIARQTDHRRPIVALAIDRGSKVVASGDEDGTVRLWSLLDGLGTARGGVSREGAIEALAFDGRGGRLFSLASGSVEEHRLDGSRVVKHRALSAEGVTALAVSQDGRRLITGDRHGRLLLWEDDRRPKVLRQQHFPDAIVAVEFAPQVNGALVVTEGRELAFFDLRKEQRDGAEFQLHRFDKLAEVPRQLVVAGDRAVTVGESEAPEVWALNEQERQASALFRLDAANGGVLEVATEHALAFTGDTSGAVRAWHLDASGGRGAAILDDHRGDSIKAIDLSTLGNRLASVGADGTVLVYQLDGERPGASVTLPGSTGVSIREVAFSPDARWLAAVAEGEVLLWSMDTEREEPSRVGQEGASHVAWLGDEGGTRLVSSGHTSVVRWEVEPQLRHVRELPAEGLLGYLAAGAEFVAATTVQDGKSRLYVWKGSEELELGDEAERLHEARAIAFSRHGKFLVVGYADGLVQSWSRRSDGRGFDANRAWSGNSVTTLAFSSDDVVVGDVGGGVRVMRIGESTPVDLARGDLGAEGQIAGLGAGPDAVVWARGSQLMLSRKGFDRRSDVRSVELIGHRGPISDVVVRGGEIAVSASSDGTLRIWPLSPGLLVTRARQPF